MTLITRTSLLLFLPAILLATAWSAESPFHATLCEGAYKRHVQGICTNQKDAIYWCWTDVLVKTDANGRVIKQVPVANHHGDLCFYDGRVYVATNLGKFNEPAGKADSWVFVYDGQTLAEVARYPVPELVHGAGGITYHDGRFIIVGGLPKGVNENYLYEYDEAFKCRTRHVLASGYTLMGIQTVASADGALWFGCYGKPAELLRSDGGFRFTNKWPFNASYGIAPLGQGRFLIAQNKQTKDKLNHGSVVIARFDEKAGLAIEKP